MDDLERSKDRDETPIIEAKPHWAYLLRVVPLGLLGLLFVTGGSGFAAHSAGSSLNLVVLSGMCLLGLDVLVLGLALLGYFNTSIQVTNRRLILRTGALNRRSEEVMLHELEGVSVHQSPAGRRLGYGTLGIRWLGARRRVFSALERPEEVREAIRQQMVSRGG